MKSPFPGMNPWLEGYMWPDVHHDLASTIRFLIAPLIAPKYVARLDIATILDNDPESEIGITYPDVEILQNRNIVREPVTAYGLTMTEPNIITTYKLPIEVRIAVVEIRDTANNKLITAIEILSPVNKRNSNLINYRNKISDLHTSDVHVLEIDLLRRGTRPFNYKKNTGSYQMMLLRAKTNKAAIWTVAIQDKLPILPIPLMAPDPDVLLDLGKALDIVFERGLYHLSIDYTEKPAPPAFIEQDWDWMQQVVKL